MENKVMNFMNCHIGKRLDLYYFKLTDCTIEG